MLRVSCRNPVTSRTKTHSRTISANVKGKQPAASNRQQTLDPDDLVAILSDPEQQNLLQIGSKKRIRVEAKKTSVQKVGLSSYAISQCEDVSDMHGRPFHLTEASLARFRL